MTNQKFTKGEGWKSKILKISKFLLIFLVVISWIFSGFPQIFNFPPGIQEAEANTTNLIVTSCDINDVSDTTCYNAIIADDGSSDTLATKTEHLDAPFQTLNADSVNSATLYYDSWGVMGTNEDWWIYVKDARDGNTICSVNPAPEYASETTDSFDCSAITAAQLSAGVWLYIAGNDAKGPNYNNIEYIRLYVDYTPPAVSISLNRNTEAFGIVALEDTVNNSVDPIVITVVSGPADLKVRTTVFADNGNSWTLGTSNGPNQVKWEFSKDGSSWTIFQVAGQDYSFDTGVPTSGTRDLHLQLTMPTETASYNQYSATVTIVASAP